jgi:hypothetical protein
MGQPRFIIDILNPHRLSTFMCINTRGFSNYYAQDINFDIFGLDTGSKVINKYNYQASRFPLWSPASNDFVMAVQITLDGLMSIRDYKDNSKIIVDKLFKTSYGDPVFNGTLYCDGIVNYYSVGILPLRGIDDRLYFFDLANQRLWKNSIEINKDMLYEKTGRRVSSVAGIIIIRRIVDTKGNSYNVILHKSNSDIVYSLIIDDNLVELNLDKDKLCDLSRIEKAYYTCQEDTINPSRPLSLDYPSCLTFKTLKDYFYFT